MPVFPSTGIGPGDPGDLITDDYQYQFGRCLIGAGQPIVAERITGLLGNAPTRVSDIDRSNGHGSIPGALLFSARTIAFDLKISDQVGLSDSIEDLLDELAGAFQPPSVRHTQDLDIFAYKRRGRAIRQFFCRASKCDIDSTFEVARGLAIGSVELIATDPISYGLELNTVSNVLGIGVTSGSVVVNNSGNSRNGTAPLIFIGGPSTNPIIQNSDDENRQFKLQTILAANQIVRIDMDAMTVAVQTGGGTNPWVEDYTIVRDDSQWWNVMPGDNTITYARTGSAATSNFSLDWYDSWVRG